MFDPSVPEEKTRLAALDSTPALDDETRRLEILDSYRVVDTPPEPTYDDIVNMASLMCGTPIALVSLITEDRQWFKARVGLEASETPRDQAFCAHAIRDPLSVMEVQDASKDPRFMHNPLVTGEPGIRFYAGAPLLTPSGAALGTVCVIDRVPRELTPAMAQGLQALARQAGELLALRRANSDLETLNQSVMEMQVELEQYQVQLESENTSLAQSNPIESVTGLNNQRAFERLLVDEIQRMERNGTALALLLADIDHYRVFARDFGNVAADDALRRVAKAFKAQARGYDTLACLQSRRLAVLLPGTDAAELVAVAERFRRAVAALPPIGRGLRVSVGVAVARPADAPLDIMESAAAALGHATEQGGNQVVVSGA
jgi:diguanylate cyclase (GGDEF)-like protein